MVLNGLRLVFWLSSWTYFVFRRLELKMAASFITRVGPTALNRKLKSEVCYLGPALVILLFLFVSTLPRPVFYFRPSAFSLLHMVRSFSSCHAMFRNIPRHLAFLGIVFLLPFPYSM